MSDYVIPAHVIEYWRNEGKSEAEIAELDRRFVADAAQRNIHIHDPRSAAHKLPSATRLSELNQKMSASAIARAYGVTYKTVLKRLRDAGYEPVDWRGGKGG